MRRGLTAIMAMIERANRGILIFSYIVIIAVCFVAVIFRYVLNDSLTWAEEVARYLFIAMVFLGGAYVILEDGHLRMDVLYTSVPRAIRRAIDGLTVVCALFFLGTALVAVWSGLGIVGGQRWSTLPLPMQLAYLPMLIAIGLGLLYLLQLAIRGKAVPEPPAGDDPGMAAGHEKVTRP